MGYCKKGYHLMMPGALQFVLQGLQVVQLLTYTKASWFYRTVVRVYYSRFFDEQIQNPLFYDVFMTPK